MNEDVVIENLFIVFQVNCDRCECKILDVELEVKPESDP